MKTSYIRDIVSLITSDQGSTFAYSPEDFDDSVHLAQMKHFKRKLGLPEEYSPGTPVTQQAFEINSKITADLRVFKKTAGFDNSPINPIKGTGKYNLPSDFYYPSTLSWMITVGGQIVERKVRILSGLEFQDVTASFVKNPNVFFPVAEIMNSYIRVEPKKDIPVHLSYLRFPTKPITKVIDNDGFYEIDTENSIDLEWDEINLNDIIVIMLGDMGIAINSEAVAQYSQNLKERGV